MCLSLASLPAFSNQHDILGKLFAIIALELHSLYFEASVVLIFADCICLEGHVGATVSVTCRTVIHFDGFLRLTTRKRELSFLASLDFDFSLLGQFTLELSLTSGVGFVPTGLSLKWGRRYLLALSHFTQHDFLTELALFVVIGDPLRIAPTTGFWAWRPRRLLNVTSWIERELETLIPRPIGVI